MKRLFGVLVIAVYSLILSSLFVPISHTSLFQFAKEFFIRLAIVAVFAAGTSIFLNLGIAEPYRITETPQTISKDEVSPIELQDEPLVNQFQSSQTQAIARSILDIGFSNLLHDSDLVVVAPGVGLQID